MIYKIEQFADRLNSKITDLLNGMGDKARVSIFGDKKLSLLISQNKVKIKIITPAAKVKVAKMPTEAVQAINAFKKTFKSNADLRMLAILLYRSNEEFQKIKISDIPADQFDIIRGLAKSLDQQINQKLLTVKAIVKP